jgi:acyl-CoA thioester hydrolase
MNEINYKEHSHYDDVLTVYTRMAYIKNSSFGFEHIIVNSKTGAVVADGAGVIVHVDPKTRKSIPLEEDFISKVKAYDPNVTIMR